jgi:hypothetical protein
MIRLRVAMHAGEVQYDEYGVTGTAVNHTFRLLEAERLKTALSTSTGIVGVIASSWFFEEVIRQDPGGGQPHTASPTGCDRPAVESFHPHSIVQRLVAH